MASPSQPDEWHQLMGKDSERVIQRLQASVEQDALDQPQRAKDLRALGWEYYAMYLRTSDCTHLDSAIGFFQTSIDQTTQWQDNYQRAEMFQCLGLAYMARYAQTDDTADLDKAIDSSQVFVDQISLHEPQFAEQCQCLGLMYANRHEITSSITDIDTAVRYLQDSVAQTPLDHVKRIERVFSLGVAYQSKYYKTSNTVDLDAAIEHLEVALDKTSVDHPQRAALLQRLGQGLGQRYVRTSNISDRDLGLTLLQASIEQTSADHPDRPERLQDLGLAYFSRYETTGDIKSLDTALECLRISTTQFPPNSVLCIIGLTCLGNGYRDRYLRTGYTMDLDLALKWAQAAVDQTSSDHPIRAGQLESLAKCYHAKYLRTSDSTDLDLAAKHLQVSVDGTPPDDTERASRLQCLGSVYRDMYKKRGSADDLDEAIKCFYESTHQTSQNHIHYANRLRELGVGHFDRYKRAGDAADLDVAIEYLQASVDSTTLEHPDRAHRLHALGNVYQNQYYKTSNIIDLDVAIQKLEEAIDTTSSAVTDRLQATMDLLPLYGRKGEWKQAHKISRNAVKLIPLLTPRFLTHSDKQHSIATIVGLASDSAAVALHSTSDAFEAVRLLELGRGVISGSLAELRADVSTLLSSHPELGKAFVHLRELLTSSEPSISPLSQSSDITDPRYDAFNRMETVLSSIRSKHGFENFLLPPEIEDIHEAAASGIVVIVNISRYRCDAILIEHHTIRSIPLAKLTVGEIDQRTQNRDFGSFGTLRWLWDTIAEPVLEALGLFHEPPSDSKWPHIWWIPTRSLTKFPLHAAGRHQERSSSGTVLDRVMSSYSTSVKAILHCRATRHSGLSPLVSRRALLVAVPKAPGCRPLPFATQEVAMIREICRSMAVDPIEPGGRQKSNVVSSLPQCQIFHFAGHGSTDETDPSRSFLLLEDWKTDPLRLADLLEMNLQNSLPFLAYLSACGTGQIKADKLLDESVHLISAFQLVGFRHVIGTLWEIEDEMCVDVARTVYEGIRDGGMTDESVCLGLHNASRMLRDVWLSTTNSAYSMRHTSLASEVRDVSFDDEQEQPVRDIVICDSDDNDDEEKVESGPFSWVPFVHYGV